MAVQVNVAGAVTVKVQFPEGDLEVVGKTRNGPDVSEQPFFLPVPGDDNGGDAGPPIDIQYLGEIAHIRLELTKYDPDIVELIRAFVAGAVLGTPASAGTLMFQQNKTARLLLDSSGAIQNFPRVVFQEPITRNVGTRFTICVITATAYKTDAGVLFNETNT